MANTTNKVVELINIQSKARKGNKSLNGFEDANKEFDKLIEKGLVKRRGYTLKTVQGVHLNRLVFNSKQD